MGSPCVSQVVPELSVYLRMTLTPDLLGSLSPVLELRVCPSPLCSADSLFCLLYINGIGQQIVF